MNRQQFLKLSGLASAGILLNKTILATAPNKHLICLLSGGVRCEDLLPFIPGTLKELPFYNNIVYSGAELSHNYSVTDALKNLDKEYIYIDSKHSDNHNITTAKSLLNSKTPIVLELRNTDVAHYNTAKYFEELKHMADVLTELYQIAKARGYQFTILSTLGRDKTGDDGCMHHNTIESRNCFCITTAKANLNTRIDLSEVLPFLSKALA